MRVDADTHVDFPAYFVRGKAPEQRRFIAEHAMLWLNYLHETGVRGAIYFDIDHTLINGRLAAEGGFEAMRQLYQQMRLKFPVYVCTARPDTDHEYVMGLLRSKGFDPPDVSHLYMLPAADYDGPTDLVRDFKDRTFHEIVAKHGRVVARFGDKLWDVAPRHAPHLDHVSDEHCYLFWDKAYGGHTLSAKLPPQK